MANALKTVRPLKKFANRFSVEGFNAGRPVHVIENTDASGTEINVIYRYRRNVVPQARCDDHRLISVESTRLGNSTPTSVGVFFYTYFCLY